LVIPIQNLKLVLDRRFFLRLNIWENIRRSILIGMFMLKGRIYLKLIIILAMMFILLLKLNLILEKKSILELTLLMLIIRFITNLKWKFLLNIIYLFWNIFIKLFIQIRMLVFFIFIICHLFIFHMIKIFISIWQTAFILFLILKAVLRS